MYHNPLNRAALVQVVFGEMLGKNRNVMLLAGNRCVAERCTHQNAFGTQSRVAKGSRLADGGGRGGG